MDSAKDPLTFDSAYDPILINGIEYLKSINPDALDVDTITYLDELLQRCQDYQSMDLELERQIAKNQSMQRRIFFFFAALFVIEILYSLAIGYELIQPLSNVKVLMLTFMLLFIGLAYSVFRK